MKKINILTVAGLSLLISLTGACSSGTTPNNTTTINANRAANTTAVTNTGAANDASHNSTDDETPAAVKAAFPGAQSFTKQHKDISANQVADIEKTTGGKVSEKDHHSYLAFSTVGGKRTQIGAATEVKAGGKNVVIIYENKDGSPAIKEVRADGVAKEFLAQFSGKGHDDKLQIGADLKANGADDATAKAIADAVRVDQATMQTLYGSAHSH